MRVYICGTWDGTNLWLQWSDEAPEAGYHVRIRLRENETKEWEPWQPVASSDPAFDSADPFRRSWIVVPTWRAGWMAEAAVKIATGEEWVQAQEVTFLRSRCRFRFSTERRPLRYAKGEEFHSIVDAGGCHYALQEELWLEPGQSADMELVATMDSGFCQIDHAGDFEMRPALGVLIKNLEPSRNDVEMTGREFTVIQPTARKSPIKIVFSGVNYFNGGHAHE